MRSAFSGRGGEFSLGNYFSGDEVGVFGGVSHQFTSLPLTLMAEYNPDQYDWDVSRGGESTSSPWSAGLTYAAFASEQKIAILLSQRLIGRKEW